MTAMHLPRARLAIYCRPVLLCWFALALACVAYGVVAGWGTTVGVVMAVIALVLATSFLLALRGYRWALKLLRAGFIAYGICLVMSLPVLHEVERQGWFWPLWTLAILAIAWSIVVFDSTLKQSAATHA